MRESVLSVGVESLGGRVFYQLAASSRTLLGLLLEGFLDKPLFQGDGLVRECGAGKARYLRSVVPLKKRTVNTSISIQN